MSDPNKMQIGGNHYAAEYQHWDWVVDLGIGYLEGNASKYVSRWRKKGGIDDLRKAAHYVDKLRNCVGAGRIDKSARRALAPKDWWDATNRFARFANLSQLEWAFCQIMAGWQRDSDLTRARAIVDSLIVGAMGPAKVPLEDSNKHAIYQQEQERS